MQTSQQKRPWYMTDSGMACALAIQLTVWILCMVFFVAIAGAGGLLIGHFVGCLCALFGFPSELFLGGDETVDYD
jgi:hypothetical protein